MYRASKTYTHTHAHTDARMQQYDYDDQPTAILGRRSNNMISKNHARLERSQLCDRRNGREDEVVAYHIHEISGCLRQARRASTKRPCFSRVLQSGNGHNPCTFHHTQCMSTNAHSWWVWKLLAFLHPHRADAKKNERPTF